jgi:hypothetical protein
MVTRHFKLKLFPGLHGRGLCPGSLGGLETVMLITFLEFFQSIDWSPLEKMEIMKFRAPHSPGWEVAKYGEQFEATYRSAFAPDTPDYVAFTIDEMARWLFSRQAYLDAK